MAYKRVIYTNVGLIKLSNLQKTDNKGEYLVEKVKFNNVNPNLSDDDIMGCLMQISDLFDPDVYSVDDYYVCPTYNLQPA